MTGKIRLLIVGLGNMGLSHAVACHELEGFEIVGLCARSLNSDTVLPEDLSRYPRYSSFDDALAQSCPDAVCISTYPDTHADYAIKAFEAGAHVFLEKPVAQTVEDARRVVGSARANNCKLVVGYILRHHPGWMKLVEIAQSLGKPLVMRMNLNQQSSGPTWETHKTLMQSISPIVDCGVHYVDMMCLMTQAEPVSVQAIGARLSDEIAEDMYNYGHLHVSFSDGSIGWYEAGWGPMMSETAFFVKDVVGPRGSASIVIADPDKGGAASDDIGAHTQTSKIRLHHAERDAHGAFLKSDTMIDMSDEPDHDGLCLREQQFFLDAIQNDVDLSEHMRDAVNSLRIVLAADQSIREGGIVKL